MELSNFLIILGLGVAGIGGWISYFYGGVIWVALAVTMFAVGNTLLVLLNVGILK